MKYKIVVWHNPYDENKFWGVSTSHIVGEKIYSRKPDLEAVIKFGIYTIDELPKIEAVYHSIEDMELSKEVSKGNATLIESYNFGTINGFSITGTEKDIKVNVSVVGIEADELCSNITYDQVAGMELSDIMVETIETDINQKQIFVVLDIQFETLFKLNFGMSFEDFAKKVEKDEGFSVDWDYHDQVFVCDECGTLDVTTTEYATNHRMIKTEDEENLLVGINCGCYNDIVGENIKPFINNTTQAITSTLAKKLQKEGLLETIESACSTMWSYTNKTPEEIVNEIHLKKMDGDIELKESDGVIFAIDDVAQFSVCYTAYIYRNKEG